MKRTVRWFRFFAVLVLLAFTASFAPGAARAQGTNPPGVTPTLTAVVTVEKNHTFEDKDWPIIRSEDQQTRDPNTGEIYTIHITLRQAPAGAVPAPSNGCPVSGSAMAASGCTYLGASSLNAQDAHLSGIVSNISHYVYVYCYNAICDVYQPYKVVAWWTRTNGYWSARNANLTWGTGGAWLRCTDGSHYSHYYTDGPFTPQWNVNTSYYYSWQLSWPQFQPTHGYPATASMTSDGYSSSGYVGSMLAHADFNQ